VLGGRGCCLLLWDRFPTCPGARTGWKPVPQERGGTAMIALKLILVPTDFSEPSQVAVRYAKALADAFGASLLLLHVLDEVHLAWLANEGFSPALGTDLRGEAEKSARDRLAALLTDAERDKYHARSVLRVGSPFVEVVRCAREENVDLIVMGTHGRGAIAHL